MSILIAYAKSFRNANPGPDRAYTRAVSMASNWFRQFNTRINVIKLCVSCKHEYLYELSAYPTLSVE